MVQMIVIDGSEHARKYELAKQLAGRLGWDVVQLRHQKGDQYKRYLSHYTLHNQVILIAGHLSEVVFSRVHNRIPPFSKEERQILDQVLVERSLPLLLRASLDDEQSQEFAEEYRATLSPHDYRVIDEISTGAIDELVKRATQ